MKQQSVHACSEGIKILENFTYLGSMLQNNSWLHLKVLGGIYLALGVVKMLKHKYMAS